MRTGRERLADVDGVQIAVPVGISRAARRSWRAKRPDGTSRQFSDGKQNPIVSLDEAKRWLTGLPTRSQYDMDLSKMPYRTIRVTRRFRNGLKDSLPRFELEIPASKSEWREPWMRIYIGSLETVTQQRIDDAVATLHARWTEYRKLLDRHGRERLRAEGMTAQLAQLTRTAEPGTALYPTRLSLVDLMAWTGKGSSISFSPGHLVDHDRAEPFWPEKSNYERRAARSRQRKEKALSTAAGESAAAG